MSRAHYKADVPSVTDLLKWAGYYDGYPHDPTGYYFKRGHFVDQCCALLAQGLVLDDRTMDVAREVRVKPLAVSATDTWHEYVRAFAEWCSDHKIEYVASQQYVYCPFERVQGTFDLLLRVDGVLTLIDIKCGACLPCTKLQTALYVIALRGCPEYAKLPVSRMGLQLEPLKYTEHPYGDFRDFDAGRLLVRWFHKSRDYR